ncbi:hypothetical protein I4U23_025584 [Adineta vaga]|nr:hypothetical protein I4U23_025584 [Adineta vaga]
MFWILLLFLNSVVTDDSMEKFKSCNSEECILMQCYFPVSEFLNATQNELKVFENFIESNHIFISYHLCNDLSVDNMDEVGACIYGILFKLYQFDANLTVHQRVHVQQAQIQDESIAIVIDMISKLLYRIESMDDSEKLKNFIRKSKKEEDVVVINASSLTPKLHLDVSRTILNYGLWFTFVYAAILDNKKTDCLYNLYLSDDKMDSSKCIMENDIRMTLEQLIGTNTDQLDTIKSYSDLFRVNGFPRILPTLFYIHKNSTFTLVSNKHIIIIPIDILNFKTTDVDDHLLLHGPYPFYLFWSSKQNAFQRLGDQPSDELINMLLYNEQEHDMKNAYGMIDDEVRYLADSFNEIEPNPNVIFLKTQNDYFQIRKTSPKTAVLFTVKWDSTSKLARRTFHHLALHLHTYLPMIDIDCFDWTDLCHEENILQWPTLILTENIPESKRYQGSTNEQEMGLTLFRFAVNQPYEIEDEMIKNNLLNSQQIIVLARIQHEEKSLYNIYKNLVDIFRDNEHIFFMFHYTIERSSLMIKQKHGDVHSSFEPKTTVYPFNEDISYLQTLINDALRIQLIPFNPVDFIKSTSTLFIVASHSQLSQLNHYFTSEDSFEELPVVWIDTNSPWILTINQYGDIVYPAMIYIDFSKGHVYVNSTLIDVNIWIKTVRMRSTTPFYELSSIEMNERPSQEATDFNKEMNDEQLLDEYHLIHEESEKINEHGLGFDMNGIPIETMG